MYLALRELTSISLTVSHYRDSCDGVNVLFTFTLLYFT